MPCPLLWRLLLLEALVAEGKIRLRCEPVHRSRSHHIPTLATVCGLRACLLLCWPAQPTRDHLALLLCFLSELGLPL